MFGKTATEVMWITEAEENSYYQTRAESHGCIYVSRLSITEENGQSQLKMTFDGQAIGFVAKVFSCLFGFLVTRLMRKEIVKDLEDLKAAVERG